MQFAALRKRVVEAHHALVDAGLVVLTFGNASEVDRDKEVIAIKPSGVPYDQLVPEAIVIVDLHTGAVANGGYRPSSDTPTHRVLYRKFAAIGAVVHTHSAAATAWSQARRDLPCFGTTHADHFFGPVPTTRALNRDEVQHQYEERTGEVSRREESHLPALVEPGVNVSAHRAPIVQPLGRTPHRQCANRPGWRRQTSAMNLIALVLWRRSRLYFRMAHLTSVSLKWRKTGYNMDL